MIDERRVLEALTEVCDPELDEPITELGFVKDIAVDGGRVAVTLWLPTYFCAPNFAYLMAGDAKAALERLEGVAAVSVRLVDHHAAGEINDGLATDRPFDDIFPGETAGTGLSELRRRFDRKAFIARQQQLYRSLAEAGLSPAAVTRLRLADLPEGPATRRYLDRRARLALDTSPGAPFLVTVDGDPIGDEDLDRHLLFARTVSVSIEGNASFCRGLLATRYGLAEPVPPKEGART